MPVASQNKERSLRAPRAGHYPVRKQTPFARVERNFPVEISDRLHRWMKAKSPGWIAGTMLVPKTRRRTSPNVLTTSPANSQPRAADSVSERFIATLALRARMLSCWRGNWLALREPYRRTAPRPQILPRTGKRASGTVSWLWPPIPAPCQWLSYRCSSFPHPDAILTLLVKPEWHNRLCPGSMLLYIIPQPTA